MSGLLNNSTVRPVRRTKSAIDADIKAIKEMAKECAKKLKDLENERMGIEYVNDFAKIRNNILFLDFDVKFNGYSFDYNFDITDEGFDDGNDDKRKFCADCGSSSGEISRRASIDIAIENIATTIKAQKELLDFLTEQKDKGVEWIADTNDCDPEEYIFDE